MIDYVLLLVVISDALAGQVYFKEDGHGGYSYGHSADLSSKHESSSNGHVHGSFSYIDGDGHLQTAHYTAGPYHGFRIHATNLPIAPAEHGHFHPYTYAGGYSHYNYYGPLAPLKPDGTVDYTPEVKKARAEHFAAIQAHKNGYSQFIYPLDHHHYTYPFLYAGDYSHSLEIPLKPDGTVDDLPEVKAARAHHLAEYAKVLYSRHRRSLLGFDAPLKPGGTFDETLQEDHANADPIASYKKVFSESKLPFHYHFNTDNYQNYRGTPLNLDGTVAETPEVKHTKDVHYNLNNQFIHRQKRSPKVEALGTKFSSKAARSHYLFYPRFLDVLSIHDVNRGFVQPPLEGGFVPSFKFSNSLSYPNVNLKKKKLYFAPPFAESTKPFHHSSSDFTLPPKTVEHTHKKSYEPAPLNHDGTVADTPEILAAKAAHLAAHEEALRKIVELQYTA